jgi:cyclophilin family peptidyl-prolyl cis-trans isomerase
MNKSLQISVRLLAVWICGLLVFGHAQTRRPLLDPTAPAMNVRAPELFNVRMETSRGVIVIEVHRDWAPLGTDRFYNLVRAGYYNQVRFHRVIKDKWAQFGINGDPKIAQAWRAQTILDDPPVGVANQRGTVAFAFAVPNGRTTQVFFNLRDNSATHDKEPFVPFGKISKGLEVADALYADYGESAGGGIRGGKQTPLFEGGNAWLAQNFPRLDYIKRTTVVPHKPTRR